MLINYFLYFQIEIKLKKSEGIRWDKLEGVPANEGVKQIKLGVY